MDPLSITASIVGLTSVVTTLAKFLVKLSDFRESAGSADALIDEIIDLMNEVTTLHEILKNIEEVSSQHNDLLSSEQLTYLEQLQQALETATVTLEELNRITHRRLLKDDGNENMSRQVWLHHKSDVQRLQKQLRTLRQKISTVFPDLNL